ncbi:MAG: tripartite tricarboxylate transporter substrate binding protein [Xanthobacteraceae bacterium]|nr:tripartite tricarboxylate transporter substrate binding protein [Xanthobacteraceae bacterium]
MKLPRRTFVRLAASAVAAPAISGFAWASTNRSRPVRIMVGFAPGSSADMIARVLGHGLSERTGQEFIVDNRPGIGGNLATEAVAHAAPDGHTLLMSGTSDAISTTLYQKLNFNFRRDIAPVAALIRSPNVVLVSPSVPAETVGDLVALAKADPGGLRMASAGVGSASHLAGETFKMTTGAEMVHVAYRGGGGDTYADLIAGRADVYFPALASAISHIRDGRLRALAAPGYQASTWFGIGAPRNTPADIVARLNREINAALADRAIASWIADFSGTVAAGSPADFGALIASETERWAQVIKASGTALS